MEAKIDALEERFKNLALFGQILDSPSSSGARASFFTPDYYMFRAPWECRARLPLLVFRVDRIVVTSSVVQIMKTKLPNLFVVCCFLSWWSSLLCWWMSPFFF